MALGYFPIIKIMSRSNLNYTRTEVTIYHFIGDYTEFEWAIKSFYGKCFANILGIAFVFGMYCHGCIAKLCFWACCGKFEWAILKVIEWAFFVFILYFYIGKAGATPCAVVY